MVRIAGPTGPRPSGARPGKRVTPPPSPPGGFGRRVLNGVRTRIRSTGSSSGFKGKLHKYTAIAVAASAMLLAGYSIIKDGWTKGIRNAQQNLGTDYANLYYKTGSSSRYSHLLEGAKNKGIKAVFDNNIYPATVKTWNVTLAMGKEVFNNVMPIGLAAGAILPVFFAGSTLASIISIGCIGLMLLSLGKKLTGDILGIGKKSL